MNTPVQEQYIIDAERNKTAIIGSDRLYRIRVGDYRIVYEVDVDSS